MDSNGNPRTRIGSTLSKRRLSLLVAGLGLGSALAYLLLTHEKADRTTPRPQLREHTVDDRGTGQHAASQMLRNLRDRAFDASDEKLALALGRPLEEVGAWDTGQEVIDDDVVIKARSIAMIRGVEIE
jgi:hypothetical protein